MAVEAADRIADAVVEIFAGFDLEAWENFQNFFVSGDNGRGDGFAIAIFGEEFKECGVAKILFEVSALVKVLGIDFRDRESMSAKVPREAEEGAIFFADVVEDADGGLFSGGEADDFAAGAAQFPL